ncbi:MAG: glycosyltransferase family 4 protein [Sedimentisphaerales bacterium]|jgi:glycosyltransferase involved in cell wall biosynthesis
MKNRVIFVTTVFDEVNTGPGIYAQYLWRAFKDDPDFEFNVVAPSFKENHPRLHSLDPSDQSDTLYHRVAQKALELAAGREKQTIIHGNMAHLMFDCVGYSGPWLVQVNDYAVASLWGHAHTTLLTDGLRRVMGLAWRRRQEKKVIPAATMVVCNSQFTRRRVLEAYGADERKVIAIYKAVDVLDFVRPATLPPDPLPSRPRGARLVFVGSDWPTKGLDILLKVLAHLSGRPEITLVVIADFRSPRLDAKIKLLCSKLGLSARVFFVGSPGRLALAHHLWHSDIFVLPSRREGLGVSILEAMAAGLPVIATRVGGIPEIIRTEDEGTLCEPQNPDELAAAIQLLLDNEQLCRKLAQAGPVRAREFDVNRMIKSVRKVYLELANAF